MLTSLTDFIQLWLPFEFTTAKMRVPILDGVHSCIALHSGIQLGIGYLLAMTILFVEEANSRYTFAEDYPVETPLRPNYLTLMIWHLLIVPFEALVGFILITLMLQIVRCYYT